MKKIVLGVLGAASLAASANATITLYNNRPTFQAALGGFVTDGYDDSVYGSGFQIYNNAVMSAFFNETDYQTTGFSNWNLKLSNATYCAGCNGSFFLIFTSTTFGNASGVYGAGVDILTNSSSLPYHAFITYGDNTTQNVPLAPGASFFGVTADQMITNIHFGLANGGTTTSGSFVIDNLTIGSGIPAPGALALLGLAGIASRRRRR